MTTTDYNKQATDFLTKFGIKLIISGGSKRKAPWMDDKEDECGLHYTVMLEKGEIGIDYDHIQFPFWGSINDRKNKVKPSEYDVLACLSSDVHCPETFEDFCAEFGYDEDSRKAEASFNSCDELARRLRGFFSTAEINELSEIQ